MSAVANATRKTARKAKGDGHLRRAEILEAAERIFVAEGYDRATIRKIADEVGVSSTALYMHFQDKAQIFHEIVEVTLGVLLEHNLEIAARALCPGERLRMMLEAYMRWALAHPNAYELVFVASPTVSELDPERTVELGQQCYDAFSGVVRELAAQHRVRYGSADAAAQALWMACHGVVALLIGRTQFNWVDREELMSVALDGLLHGLVIEA